MTASSILASLEEFRNRLIRDQDTINLATIESIKRGMPGGATAETLQNLESNFQAIVQDPAIKLFVPFQLWKADYLSKVLPVAYEQAYQGFRWQNKKEDSVYVLAIVRIFSDLIKQLEDYQITNEVGIPIELQPGPPGIFFPTPGTPAPAPSPGTPAPIIKASQKNILIGLASLFLISKFI